MTPYHRLLSAARTCLFMDAVSAIPLLGETLLLPADIEVDAHVKAMLELAEAAMEAEEQKQDWCFKMLKVRVTRVSPRNAR